MFSNLASYLGYAATSAKSPQVEKSTTDVRLRAVEEDEWVLVERNENEGSTSKKEVEEDAEMTRVTLAVSTWPSSVPGSSKGLSRSASLDILPALQESWYLTPPPSFTSKGPVHMETSPLENLLIEHPSMFVYEHSQHPDISKKMSNSSPSSTGSAEEERPALLSPIQERIFNLPQHKLKVSKTQSSQSSAGAGYSETEEKICETKEPKMKSFVKSPRRSINAEIQNLPKKPLRKRPDTSLGSEMISKTSASKEPLREEKTPIVPTVQRRLYSEVLASNSKAVPVQTSPKDSSSQKKEEVQPELKPKPAPSPVISKNRESASTTEAPEAAAAASSPATEENESVMSVEEDSSEETSDQQQEDRDRRKAVQTLPDRQHRLHFLNRSAQKVEQRKTCELMKKNNIVRTNKAREYNFRNKRQRRADMMQRHSGANNNRKCAKTTLY